MPSLSAKELHQMAQNAHLIQYQVRPVTRFIVTRYETGPEGGSISERGEYNNADVAYEVAYALCKRDHEVTGYPIGDDRIQYPRHPIDTEKAFTPVKA